MEAVKEISCTECTFINEETSNICLMCRSPIFRGDAKRQKIEDFKECPACTYRNIKTSLFCDVCKHNLSIEEVLKPEKPVKDFIICPKCTYRNFTVLGKNNCEMCEAELRTDSSKITTNDISAPAHFINCTRCTMLFNTNESENECPTCGFIMPNATKSSIRGESKRLKSSNHLNRDTVNNNDDAVVDLSTVATTLTSHDNKPLNEGFSSELCTDGIIELLQAVIPRQSYNSLVFHICSPCPHITQKGVEGAKWSCGYRNIQMLCLSLMKRPEYRRVLFGGSEVVPDVHGIQAWIEKAWRAGFDVDGCSQLGGSILGTDIWIGATECAALLRFMGIRANVVDFSGLKHLAEKAAKASMLHITVGQDHTNITSFVEGFNIIENGPEDIESLSVSSSSHGSDEDYVTNKPNRGHKSASKSSNNLGDSINGIWKSTRKRKARPGSVMKDIKHDELVTWMQEYFQWRWPPQILQPVAATRIPTTSSDTTVNLPFHSEGDADKNGQKDDIITNEERFLPPLYFQHQGHSRTVVGYEERNGITSLLIFDPSAIGKVLKSHLQEEGNYVWPKLVKRGVRTLRQEDYQIVYVAPGLMGEQERESSKIMQSERVDTFRKRYLRPL